MQEKILQDIFRYFRKTDPPEYITIRPYLEEDPYVVEIETRFKDKKREILSIEDIGWLITDIIWLDEQALAYFLPKILEITVREPQQLRNFDLLPMQLADKKVIKEKFGFLNRIQSRCILDILVFWQSDQKLLDRFPIVENLEIAIAYWSKRARVSE